MGTAVAEQFHTLYGSAVHVIRQELERTMPPARAEKAISEMVKKYQSEDIIRAADAIQRFGLDGLLAAMR